MLKTVCPIYTIGCSILEGLKEKDMNANCYGPKCQLWHKCRRPNQCPVCGEEGKAVHPKIYGHELAWMVYECLKCEIQWE